MLLLIALPLFFISCTIAQDAECKDRSIYCRYLRPFCESKSHVNLMRRECRKTCGLCDLSSTSEETTTEQIDVLSTAIARARETLTSKKPTPGKCVFPKEKRLTTAKPASTEEPEEQVIDANITVVKTKNKVEETVNIAVYNNTRTTQTTTNMLQKIIDDQKSKHSSTTKKSTTEDSLETTDSAEKSEETTTEEFEPETTTETSTTEEDILTTILTSTEEPEDLIPTTEDLETTTTTEFEDTTTKKTPTTSPTPTSTKSATTTTSVKDISSTNSVEPTTTEDPFLIVEEIEKTENPKSREIASKTVATTTEPTVTTTTTVVVNKTNEKVDVSPILPPPTLPVGNISSNSSIEAKRVKLQELMNNKDLLLPRVTTGEPETFSVSLAKTLIKGTCFDEYMYCREFGALCVHPAFSDVMALHCTLTCGRCDEVDTDDDGEEECFDKAPECKKYLDVCQSARYLSLTKEYCRKSCGFCQPKCRDRHQNCSQFAKDSFCKDEMYTVDERRHLCGETCHLCNSTSAF